MQCVKPIRLLASQDQYLTISCGKCIACRIKRREEWTLRLSHELESWKEACFLTLTYDDDSCPSQLQKRDLQLFMKRLRKFLCLKKIKYYGVGEYGDITNRPHYHIIIFGYNPPVTRYLQKTRYISDEVSKLWTYGIHTVDKVNQRTIRYVAKYIQKDNSSEIFRQEKFALMSKGLGLQFFEKEKEKIIHNKGLTVQGKHVSLPRYYWNKLDIKDTYEEFQFLKESLVRQKKVLDSYKLDSVEEIEERIMEARNQLKRRYEAKAGMSKKDTL